VAQAVQVDSHIYHWISNISGLCERKLSSVACRSMRRPFSREMAVASGFGNRVRAHLRHSNPGLSRATGEADAAETI